MEHSNHYILFVDDEAQTRKMFKRLVGANFNVVSAEDVIQAKEILSERHNEIGVLITDQRMPGELGVDLLRYVRTEYPAIIRLLTTAYSDLSDAIEAVNTGEIFRYVNKPWHADELLIDLRLAMNFFELEQDRTQLIEEKISLSKRQYHIEMLRFMITIGSTQHDFSLRHHAVSALLTQLSTVSVEHNNSHNSHHFWDDEVNKVKKMTNLAKNIFNSLKKIEKLDKKMNFKHNLSAYSQKISTNLGANFVLKDIDETVNADIFDNNMFVLLSLCSEVLGCSNLSLTAQDDNGLKLSISTNNPNNILMQQFTQQDICESELVGKLMAAFISAYHFGAQVKTQFKTDRLCAIELHFLSSYDVSDLNGNHWIEDILILHNDVYN